MHNFKICLFLLLYSLCCQTTLAQSSTPWYSYYDSKKELIGYRDDRGNIKVSPHFTGLTQAKKFNHIIAVSDGFSRKSYYLLKSGQQVGKDSLYTFDMMYDCEQENMIRFRDRKTDKVGFFDKEGEIAIKAKFNDAQPFYNGVAIVIYNGKRVCADGLPMDDKNPCEHWYWDGTTALIDHVGHIVADSIRVEQLQNINWYSKRFVRHPTDTALHLYLKARQGGYYSFVDYQKEFTRWFYQNYLIRESNHIHLSTFDVICVEGLSKKTLRTFVSSKTFGRTYHKTLLKKLHAIKSHPLETHIISESLKDMIYTQAAFKSYFTDCGEPDSERYPLFNVVTTVNNAQGQFLHQEYLSFLRTEEGYKLIGVAWKTTQ